MVTFDRTLWRQRAERRYEHRTKKRRANARLQFGRDLAAISGLSTVIEWCNKRSLVVKFTNCHGGSYDPVTHTIEINARSEPELQLFVLFHECGHELINKCGDKRVRRAHHRSGPRSLVFKIDELAEEFEAWLRGRKLADRLHVYVNNERFEQRKAELLATYVAIVA